MDLINSIQQDCLNTDVHVSALLRKARATARKLNLNDAMDWITLEMDGYREADTVPRYRITEGNPRAFNPYRGWIPIHFKHPDTAKFYSTVHLRQSIGSI